MTHFNRSETRFLIPKAIQVSSSNPSFAATALKAVLETFPLAARRAGSWGEEAQQPGSTLCSCLPSPNNHIVFVVRWSKGRGWRMGRSWAKETAPFIFKKK